MAHGFAAVRKARLDAFAARFVQAGIASVVFDYRGFGASKGMPAQSLSAADLLTAILNVPVWTNLRLFVQGLVDAVGALFGAAPVHVGVVGPPGALAVRTSPDADPGYRAMPPARPNCAFMSSRPVEAARPAGWWG